MTGQHLRDLPRFLRAPRAAGLWLVGVLIALASAVAFGLSYRGLLVWALHHQWPLDVAVFFPLLIDVLIVVCEVILFVAAIDGGTPLHVRALAWLVLLVFTGISVVGNADHAATANDLSRGGFALPPLVLAIALGFGLGELKRQAAKYRRGRGGPISGAPGTVPATSARSVPSGRFAAAEVSMAETAAAGNPWSRNQLQARFGLSRSEADEIWQPYKPPAGGSGSPPAPAGADGSRDTPGLRGVPAALNGDRPHG